MYICNNMKKNTLIYLEKNLVKRAKENKINISKITENALKEVLEEYRDRHDPSYIFENSEKTFLPYQIKKITIKQYAMFKNIEFSFKKTNLILGKNASGKTLLLKAIQGNLNPKDKITLETSSKPKKTSSEFFECLLIDDPLSRLDRNQEKFISWLKAKYKNLQLIITSRTPIKGLENVIKLESDGSDKLKMLMQKRDALTYELDRMHCDLEKNPNDKLKRNIVCVCEELEHINNEIRKMEFKPNL